MPAICLEAPRLGRLLADLMPDEPDVMGLHALMMLTESRRRLAADRAALRSAFGL